MHSRLLNKNIHKDLQKKKAAGKINEKKSRRRGVFVFVVLASLIGFTILAYLASIVASYTINLPPINTPFERKLPESTIIYDDKGNIIYTIYKDQNRIYTPLQDIPKNMQYAMLAAEDINFYSEDGINPLAIARSVVHDVFSNNADSSLQGASTITQQLVKYTSLDQSRTIERKIKEIVLTLKISQHYSKDQILEAYLNAIPFGGSNYGVEAAARAYFNKNIGQLDLAQCAFLAGLPQAPSLYSPLFSIGPGALQLGLARQRYVLEQMLKNKQVTHVTKDQITEAENEQLVFSMSQQIPYPSFSLYIKDQLYKMYGEDSVDTQGLRVYTTFDTQIQNAAQKSVEDGVAQELKIGYNAHNASLVSMDATNGNLLAMVGSVNYHDESPQVRGEVNMTLFPISPGSSVKPFVYLRAFMDGETPDTIVHDVKTTYNLNPGTYTPMDFDGKFEGDMAITRALLESRNVPAVETGNKIGIQNVYNTLLQAGLEDVKNCQYGLSISIGACEVPLIQHTTAFGILSQDGVKHPLRSILQVYDKSKKKLFDDTSIQSQQVFPADQVKKINDILKNYHTLVPVKDNGWTVAGKTGTSQDNKNNLFMGYSSHLVTGVWAGNTDQSFTSPVTYGENTAAPIWNEFMNTVLPMYPENSNF